MSDDKVKIQPRQAALKTVRCWNRIEFDLVVLPRELTILFSRFDDELNGRIVIIRIDNGRDSNRTGKEKKRKEKKRKEKVRNKNEMKPRQAK